MSQPGTVSAASATLWWAENSTIKYASDHTLRKPMATIHAIVLTYNEAIHIERCLRSIKPVCETITVVDSGSTDQTVAIAMSLGAEVVVNPWVNHAIQVNFGIERVADRGGWILRIDADEVLDECSPRISGDALDRVGLEVDGILIQRRIYFLGRRMRWGGIEPSWQLRLWRNGSGYYEQRWMDEHIKVDGHVIKSGVVFSDINHKSLSWWISKHNDFASREAIQYLNLRYGFAPHEVFNQSGASAQARLRRLLKEKVYLRLPAGSRAMAYFLYRYILRLGFLDGAAGYYFHLMQGLWYRTLVDAKVAEIITFAESEQVSIVDAIKERTGIDPVPKFLPTQEDDNVQPKDKRKTSILKELS